MKFDYQTKIFLGYSIVTTLSVILSFFKISQLETILKAAVNQKLTSKSSMLYPSMSSSACVWGVGSDNLNNVNEYVASHLSAGIIDFTFYYNGDLQLDYLTSNYTNIGMVVNFKKSTLKHHDLWECLTDNVFNPYVDVVFTSDINSYIFPLNNKYDRVRKFIGDDDMCTSFKQYEFFNSLEMDFNDNSLVANNRNRTLQYRTSDLNTRIYNLGKTSDKRVEFLKKYRLRRFKCPMSKTHGIGKIVNSLSRENTLIDNRLFEQKSMYHIQDFKP
jgi:hypothetical protein